MAIHVLSGCFIVLVVLVFAVSVSEQGNIRNFQKREHSLVKPYQGSGVGVSHWDFLSSTMVTNNYIRLTPDIRSQFGAIWNNVQCMVTAWELHVQFKVHGSGKTLFGDGMAIWYTKERMTPGPVFGNVDQFTGLAVILDTYNNYQGRNRHGHPYISVMVNNGTVQYDHETDGTRSQLAGCESQFRNKQYETYLAIRYEAETVTVSTDIDNANTWKKCLSVTGIKLPVGYYFGVSAATGDLSDNHDIISIKMYDLESDDSKMMAPLMYTGLPEAPSAEAVAADMGDADDPMGDIAGWKLLVLTLLLVLSVGGCLVAGLIIYQKQQENSRKRFY